MLRYHRRSQRNDDQSGGRHSNRGPVPNARASLAPSGSPFACRSLLPVALGTDRVAEPTDAHQNTHVGVAYSSF
jgi:hypothetical protein